MSVEVWDAEYARITSTKDEWGVTRQLEATTKLAERQSDPIELRTYVDNNVSASDPDTVRRDSFEQLLDDMRAGHIRRVFASHIDRVYRVDDDKAKLVKIAKTSKTFEQIITQLSGTTSFANAQGRFRATIDAAVSTHEIEHAAERQLDMKAQYARMGRWAGGRRPFGYDVVGRADAARLVINEREAAALRSAISAVLAGRSHRSVTAELNEVRTTPMRVTSLRQLLTRPSLAGHAVHRGEIVGRGDWDAIIDDETHVRIVAHFAQRKQSGRRRPVRKYLGTSLFTCGVCHQLVTTTGGSHDKRARYVCQSSHAARIATYVDEHVRRRATIALTSERVIEALRELNSVDLGPLIAERDQLREHRKGLLASVDSGLFTLEEVTASAQTSARRLAEIEAEITAASDKSEVGDILLADFPADAFADVDVEQQRALVAMLFDVKLMPALKSRPEGWKFGESYFDTRSVKMTSKLTGIDLDELDIEGVA
jgi:site-specific DNA recombinase